MVLSYSLFSVAFIYALSSWRLEVGESHIHVSAGNEKLAEIKSLRRCEQFICNLLYFGKNPKSYEEINFITKDIASIPTYPTYPIIEFHESIMGIMVIVCPT